MKNNKFLIFIAILVVGLSVYFYGQFRSGTNSLVTVDKTSNPTKSDKPVNENGRYRVYNENEYGLVADRKRVIFFHASWCPTCKVADEEFMSQAEKIPVDVVLFKTDYDTESQLKKKYGITYQHTFVLVDMEGNEIKKWNGGGIEELINNT